MYLHSFNLRSARSKASNYSYFSQNNQTIKSRHNHDWRERERDSERETAKPVVQLSKKSKSVGTVEQAASVVDHTSIVLPRQRSFWKHVEARGCICCSRLQSLVTTWLKYKPIRERHSFHRTCQVIVLYSIILEGEEAKNASEWNGYRCVMRDSIIA